MENTHACSCGHCEVSIKDSLAVKSVETVSEEGCGCGSESCDTHSEEKSLHITQGINQEVILKATRLGVSLILLLIASFAPLSEVVKIGVFMVAYVLAGYNVLWEAIKGIIHLEWLDENFLMVIASIAAFIIGEYPEGVAVIIFYGVGGLFEDLAINRSRKSIQSLMSIKPEIARIQKGEQWVECDPNEVSVDHLIMVKAGERIPLDGVVVEGNSSLDTSAITGESLLREVGSGSTVYSGTINVDGILYIKVTKRFKESAVSRILELVEYASEQKAETEKFITKFARYYTPAVVGAATLFAVIPPLMGLGDWKTWFYRAAIFLVVSCPCGLVISIPLGYFGGIGSASKHGILIKGGNFLEVLRKLDTVIVDKTGTLTRGRFEVTEVISLDPSYTADNVLELAAELERFSHHPLAKSVVNAYDKKVKNAVSGNPESISIRLSDIVEHKGRGIEAKYDGASLLAGNLNWLKSLGFVNKSEDRLSGLNEGIGTSIYIGLGNVLIGRILLEDMIKEEAKESIQALRQLGVKKIVMLTGDDNKIATQVAEKVGITEFFAQLLPEDKVKHVEKIQGVKAFIGDGINDAPVLAMADLGIAMGGIGSDAAIEASDMVIMSDQLIAIPKAIRIARFAHTIIWQNIIFSFGIKGIILLLAVFGFANMWLAVFADVGVAIIAILNAIRALNYRVDVN